VVVLLLLLLLLLEEEDGLVADGDAAAAIVCCWSSVFLRMERVADRPPRPPPMIAIFKGGRCGWEGTEEMDDDIAVVRVLGAADRRERASD
jgi:hypothetical protein